MLVSFSFLFFLSCIQVYTIFPSVSSLSAAQDAGLDALAAVISRQKIMGQEIGNELEEQNGKVYLCLNLFVKQKKIIQSNYMRQCESNQTCLFCIEMRCLM